MVKLYIFASNHTHTKINKHKDLLLFTLNINKLILIKHKNNTNITQLLGTYIFMPYLQEIVNQKVNILMKKNKNKK